MLAVSCYIHHNQRFLELFSCSVKFAINSTNILIREASSVQNDDGPQIEMSALFTVNATTPEQL